MQMTSDGKYILSPVALIFPHLSPSEFQQMVESVRERGLEKPITLWQGQIIDGRHRYEACLLAGVEPRFQKLPGDHNPLDRVMDEKRRQAPHEREPEGHCRPQALGGILP